MSALWAYENERRRVFVTEDDADYSATWQLPAPREFVWEYTTSPAKRMQWNRQITSFE